jgi:quinol monooxygenase YgiN
MTDSAADQVAVVAHISARPGKEGDLLKLLRGLLEPTRNEVGCIRYELNQEIENPAAFTFAEKFASPNAYAAHLKMRHVKRFAEQSIDLVESRRVRMHRELLPVAGSTGATPKGDETQIVVIAHFTAKPRKEEELSTFLQGLVEPTRREPGCLRYELNQDRDEPATFSFVETFADREGFDAHCRMPYIEKLFETLKVLVAEQYIGLHRQILA